MQVAVFFSFVPCRYRVYVSIVNKNASAVLSMLGVIIVWEFSYMNKCGFG